VIISDFEAVCAPGGVMLGWAVNTELFSTRYTVDHNGATILDSPADCPGCVAPATYSETVLLPDASGTYTLALWNGVNLTDTETATLGSCVPTAVRVSKFAASGHKWLYAGWKVWRITILERDE
jgi:hypothetical protein